MAAPRPGSFAAQVKIQLVGGGVPLARPQELRKRASRLEYCANRPLTERMGAHALSLGPVPELGEGP